MTTLIPMKQRVKVVMLQYKAWQLLGYRHHHHHSATATTLQMTMVMKVLGVQLLQAKIKIGRH